ncbi:MAG: hypothetical protein J6V80_05665, partial [Clostridia bacterium]|nr:hypothetical protein [Clostridia bacterium]
MKTAKMERILAIVITLTMLLSMMLVFTVSGNAEANGYKYTLKASDLKAFAAGGADNGDYVKAGTDKYFTVIYSAKAAVASNEKTFSDGVSVSQRIAWGDKTTVGDEVLNAVMIKTAGSATVKVWLVCGDNGRDVAIFGQDGSIVSKTDLSTEKVPEDDADGLKNNLFIKELKIPSAGIYYIGNTGGSNYFYQITVTDTADGGESAPRADWASVAAPQITSATDSGEGSITVGVDALIGHDGADELLVHMYGADGTLISTKGSVIEKSSHTISFYPADSGNYTFKAELLRAGQENKAGAETVDADFVYPLSSPYLSSATSKGDGKVELIWSKVHEAASYDIYVNGSKVGSVSGDQNIYMATGLTIDQEYSFAVSAVRGSEQMQSNTLKAIATKDSQITWSFTIYGPSTNEDNNGYIGNVNKDGYVTVYSEGGKGKIQPDSVDGLALYYTAIPKEYNFTLRAKVSVDKWTYSN